MDDGRDMLSDNQLVELTLAFLEQRCTPADAEQLGVALKADPAQRRLFNRVVAQTWLMRESRATMAESMLIAADVDHLRPFRRRGRTALLSAGRRIGRPILAVAATVLISLTVWWFLDAVTRPSTSAPAPNASHDMAVATLTDMQNAVFADTERPMNLGGTLSTGPIRLTSGMAQIMFNSTAVVDMVGPCAFEMTGPNQGKLTSGRIVAYVPANARGFTVNLPRGAYVVDLGTRFELRVDETSTTLMVSQGRVELHWTSSAGEAQVRTLSPGVPVKLVSGQTSRFDDASQLIQLVRTVISLNPRQTYLHSVGEQSESPMPVDLAALGIDPGMTITLMQLGDYQGQKQNEDRIQTLAAVFSASDVLLGRDHLCRVRDALACESGEVQTPPAAAVNAQGLHEPTDIAEDFDVTTEGIRVVVPDGARFLFFSPRDSYFSDNSDPDGDYAVSIENDALSSAQPTESHGAEALTIPSTPVTPNAAGQ
ncbi:hypothetical protein HED60_11490 [Planctomycetales bacterium ZRK34]|nr:hypothetical protein HED60_11490 [Planctomycetales bacterium ZRK34]